MDDYGAESLEQLLHEALIQPLGACPSCGTNDWEYFGGCRHFGARLAYWICPQCSLVGQSPMFSEDVLPRLYSSLYWKEYGKVPEPEEHNYDWQRIRGYNLLKIFWRATNQAPIERIIDIGSSTGGLLKVAELHYGARQLVGVEYDSVYSEFARSKGCDIYGSLDEVEEAGLGAFDVVTMSHVLEHIYDIKGVLRRLYDLLRKDGYLCIEVPHSCENACFQFSHLWGFNESSLACLLNSAGYKVIYFLRHGFPRLPDRRNHYLAVIAKKNGQQNLLDYTKFSTSPYKERKDRYLNARSGKTVGDFYVVPEREVFNIMFSKVLQVRI